MVAPVPVWPLTTEEDPLRLRLAATALASGATAIGAIALVGWAFNSEIVVSFGLGDGVITPGVAVSMVLLGLAMILLTTTRGGPVGQLLGAVMAAALVLLCTTTLLELSTSAEVGAYRLLAIGDLAERDPAINQTPSPQAMMAILFLAAALLVALTTRTWGKRLGASLLLGLAGLAAGAQSVISHLIGSHDHVAGAGSDATELNLATGLAVSLAAMAMILLLAGPSLVELKEDPPAWRVIARLGPAVLLVPLLRLAASHTMGEAGPPQAIIEAIILTALLSVLVMLVWWTSTEVRGLHRVSADIVAALPVAALVEVDGDLVLANEAAHLLFAGSQRSIPEASRLADLLGVDQETMDSLRRRATRVGPTTEEFFPTWSPNSPEMIVGVSVRQIDWKSQPALLAVVLDRTDQRLYEESLRSARTVAEAANAAKSEFLSRMSHELRTPLNSVIGFAQVLRADPGSNKDLEAVEAILKAGRHLLSLINEVLDLSAIEMGHLNLSPEPVLVDDVAEEVIGLLQPMASEASVELRFVSRTGCCKYVLADRLRLIQVMTNLVSNGIKYNREGGNVLIRCEPSDNNTLHVNVVDTGLGLNEQQIARIFDPFERLGHEYSDIEGTGVGLALTRHLLESMDGRIIVTSTRGSGSIFTIELPTAEEPNGRATRLNGTTLSGRQREQSVAGERPLDEQTPITVLHVEDNLANAKLVERVFGLYHRPVNLIRAAQGRLGLQLARDLQPSLILLDLHLPDMSGEDVLAELVADTRTAAIPVVIVSAEAHPNHVNRLMHAGANRYLTKPIDIDELLAALDQLVPQDDE